MTEKLRVLVVDCDTVVRQGLTSRLGDHPELEVIASARNVRTAEPKVDSYAPDLVVLDLSTEPEELLAMLSRFVTRQRPLKVVGISSSAVDERAFARAIGDDCVRFVRRDEGRLSDRQIEHLHSKIVSVLEELRGATEQGAQATKTLPLVPRSPKPASKSPGSSSAKPQPEVRAVTQQRASRSSKARNRAGSGPRTQTPLVVGLGVSTGGPAALAQVIPALPADFPLPIVVVQHMPARFTRSLADSLDAASAVSVGEAVQGELLVPGRVLVAPGGRQMRVVRGKSDGRVDLTDDAPVCSCRPSVDYLFASLVSGYGSRVLGVVLTGMGEDGWAGARSLHEAGGCLLAQDQASCTVFGMPRGPIEQGLATAVALDGMARAILYHARSPSCS